MSRMLLDPSGAAQAEWNPHVIRARGGDAMLILIAPRRIDTQVIRPYTFQFGERLVSELVAHKHDLRAAVGRKPLLSPELMNTAILPSSGEGAVPLNMSYLSDRWTFSMMIDTKMPHGTQRQVAAGYFVDEPANLAYSQGGEPTLNRNAIMVFTTSSTILVQASHSATGHANQHFIRNAADVTSGLVQELAGPQMTDLYFTDPGSVMQNSAMLGQNGAINSYANLAVANQSKRHHATAASEKSPKTQLRRILSATEAANESVSTNDAVYSGMGYNPGLAGDPREEYMDALAVQLAADDMTNSMTTNGVDTTLPIALRELLSDYPQLDVRICNVSAPTWDQRSQCVESAQNVMSYMAAQVIGAVASNCGISEIAFRYNSWMSGDNPMDGPGIGEVTAVRTLIEMNDAGIAKATNTFRAIIADELFPIIRHTCGEFDINVYYNVSGQTLVNIVLLDNGDGNDGTYEHFNPLNGLVIPTIAPSEVVDSKTEQLMTLGLSLQLSTPGDQFTVHGPHNIPRGIDSDATIPVDEFLPGLNEQQFNEKYGTDFDSHTRAQFSDGDDDDGAWTPSPAPAEAPQTKLDSIHFGVV